MLDRWQKDKTKVKFVEPTIWREPNSKEDCYFWMTNTKGFNATNSHKIQHGNVFSVTKASTKFDNNNKKDCENPNLSVADMQVDEASEEVHEYGSESSDGESQGEYWVPKVKDNTYKLFNKGELSDLTRELGLPKDGAEVLASRLKERNESFTLSK